MSVKKNVRPTLLDKYDINSKVISELVHIESRKIIFAIIKKSKTIEEISDEIEFPPSSIYKKIKDLKEVSLVYVEKRDITPYGRIISYYRSRIKEARIEFNRYEPRITLIKNDIIKPKKSGMNTKSII